MLPYTHFVIGDCCWREAAAWAGNRLPVVGARTVRYSLADTVIVLYSA